MKITKDKITVEAGKKIRMRIYSNSKGSIGDIFDQGIKSGCDAFKVMSVDGAMDHSESKDFLDELKNMRTRTAPVQNAPVVNEQVQTIPPETLNLQ